MNEYVIGIDIGTSSSKGVLVRLNGEIVASTSHGERDRLSLPRPGWAEHDAEQRRDQQHADQMLAAEAEQQLGELDAEPGGGEHRDQQ